MVAFFVKYWPPSAKRSGLVIRRGQIARKGEERFIEPPYISKR